AGCTDDLVIPQVEQDLDARTIGNGRRRQAPRRDVERRMPRVVDPRRVCNPVLAGHLQVEMQGAARVTPVEVLQARPLMGHHASSSLVLQYRIGNRAAIAATLMAPMPLRG